MLLLLLVVVVAGVISRRHGRQSRYPYRSHSTSRCCFSFVVSEFADSRRLRRIYRRKFAAHVSSVSACSIFPLCSLFLSDGDSNRKIHTVITQSEHELLDFFLVQSVFCQFVNRDGCEENSNKKLRRATLGFSFRRDNKHQTGLEPIVAPRLGPAFSEPKTEQTNRKNSSKWTRIRTGLVVRAWIAEKLHPQWCFHDRCCNDLYVG